jgi:lipopolysaccharide transport system ATP-binding protein
MHAARVRPRDGRAGDAISVETPFVLEFEYRPDSAGLLPSLHLFNDEGVVVFNVGPTEPSPWRERRERGTLVRDVCHVPANLLNDGVHRVAFCLSKGNDVVFWLDDVLTFDVRDSVAQRGEWYGKWAGVVRPLLEWETGSLP